MAMAEKNTRRGLKLLTIMLADDTGVVQLNFFNQDYLKKEIKGTKKVVYLYMAKWAMPMVDMVNLP